MLAGWLFVAVNGECVGLVWKWNEFDEGWWLEEWPSLLPVRIWAWVNRLLLFSLCLFTFLVLLVYVMLHFVKAWIQHDSVTLNSLCAYKQFKSIHRCINPYMLACVIIICMYLDVWNNMRKMDWINVSHFILGKGKFVLISYCSISKMQCSKNGHLMTFWFRNRRCYLRQHSFYLYIHIRFKKKGFWSLSFTSRLI